MLWVADTLLCMHTVSETKASAAAPLREMHKTDLQCKARQLAKVVCSLNPSLVGRLVRISGLHVDGRWECELIGEPVVGLADDGDGFVFTRDWLFCDACLEPQRTDYSVRSAAASEPFFR